MKLVTFTQDGTNTRLGAIKGSWDNWEYIVDLNSVNSDLPSDMIEFIDKCGSLSGDTWESAKKVVEEAQSGINVSDVTLLSPIMPRLLRDTLACRGHVSRVRAARGAIVPENWDWLPAYYNGNHLHVVGTKTNIPVLKFLIHQNGREEKETARLDYETEIGYVIGTGGKNIKKDEARKHLFGVTIFNDFSMRDLQMPAMGVGMGPAAGKDWINALGPCIVTADEFGEFSDKRLTTKVNGETRFDGVFNDLVYKNGFVKEDERAIWSFDEIVEFISHNQDIHPGEVWGSGTIPGGCEVENGKDAQFLKKGDLVEMTVTGIGTLTNTIG